MPPIPLVDVKAQYDPLLPRLREAIEGVLTSGEFILGPNVAAFEREAAEYLGVEESIGVANGTDALVLVMDALGIGAGDEVVCPSFTFYATAEAIARRGATPVFADVDAGTMNLDPEDVAARISSRTKAILAVHLFGRPAPLAVLRIFLSELDRWVALRREAAARYAELGLDAVCELPEDEPGHVYHLFVCRSPERDRIRAALQEAGIGSAVYYTTPMHLQPALAYLGYQRGALPVTEQLAQENFSVPIWAGIDATTQEQVVSVVQASAPVAS